jgi:hypothetical protein
MIRIRVMEALILTMMNLWLMGLLSSLKMRRKKESILKESEESNRKIITMIIAN